LERMEIMPLPGKQVRIGRPTLASYCYRYIGNSDSVKSMRSK